MVCGVGRRSTYISVHGRRHLCRLPLTLSSSGDEAIGLKTATRRSGPQKFRNRNIQKLRSSNRGRDGGGYSRSTNLNLKPQFNLPPYSVHLTSHLLRLIHGLTALFLDQCKLSVAFALGELCRESRWRPQLVPNHNAENASVAIPPNSNDLLP